MALLELLSHRLNGGTEALEYIFELSGSCFESENPTSSSHPLPPSTDYINADSRSPRHTYTHIRNLPSRCAAESTSPATTELQRTWVLTNIMITGALGTMARSHTRPQLGLGTENALNKTTRPNGAGTVLLPGLRPSPRRGLQRLGGSLTPGRTAKGELSYWLPSFSLHDRHWYASGADRATADEKPTTWLTRRVQGGEMGTGDEGARHLDTSEDLQVILFGCNRQISRTLSKMKCKRAEQEQPTPKNCHDTS
ncbi:hypothetical protein CHU98_g4497 [Xylaria longipes]|nr:hypothetical protein CHU98_g4497 [Xylaria longipes]